MIPTDIVAAERERRLATLDELRRRGIDPYPPTYGRDHTLAEVRRRHAGLDAGVRTDERVRVAGRARLVRRHGGLVFITLADQTGDVQLLAARDVLGDDAFAIVDALDRGDWIGAAGTVMTTRTGELSVEVDELQLLSKSLRALPDKHHGLLDPEARLRERHLDLIGNPRSRRTFDIRSLVIAELRRALAERGFTEVETPVLEAEAGGAAARSFVTHHNALGTDRHLRIALELPLKRLVVGGYERVFEIGRVFRNEGIDATHNPEFTLLEAYQALADYRDMMELVETLVARAAQAANGTTLVEIDGTLVDLAPPWRRATMHELILEATGESLHPDMPLGAARGICDELGVAYEAGWGPGRLMCEVYEARVESALLEPTFVLDHPRETSPLARAHRDEPAYAERFEAIVGGRELANAYSELNDPVDQRARFAAQGGVDEDYVRALEYGLPPTGGLGIGVDRLVMLIAEVPSIRDVVLFPALRPPRRAPLPQDEAAPEPVEPVETAPRRPRAPRVLGALSGLVGLLLLFANVFHDQAAHDVRVVAGHVVSAVAGLGLLIIARQLRRGKRRAWAAASTLYACAALGALLRGSDPAAVAVTASLLVALVWHREAFTARSDPGSLLDVGRFVARYAIVVLAFGTGTLLLEHDHVRERLTVGGVLETIGLGLAGVRGPYEYTGRFLDTFFPAALLALGLSGLVLLSVLAFRAVRATGMPDADERDRARALVLAHGSGTLDYFALRDDKRYFFADAGDAFIAYGFLGGTALVSGDPIGTPAGRDRVIGEFLASCRARGWQVAFLGARERDLALYRRHGLRGVYLGDEAVVRCDRFTLETASKSVRAAVGRVGRECRFELLREDEATPALRAQLNALRERWLGEEADRGFTMELGGGVRGEDPRLLLALAYGGDGRPLGFLRLVPCCGDDEGWSLDLMQHDPEAPNGMTEYLIAMCATELGARGFRRLSLNFATWGRLFADGARLTPAQRIQRRVGRALSPHFQITSLRDFNAKFDPQWVPRTILVEDLGSIPRVGLLYAALEGFIRLPRHRH